MRDSDTVACFVTGVSDGKPVEPLVRNDKDGR